jgi:hypothetical protein
MLENAVRIPLIRTNQAHHVARALVLDDRVDALSASTIRFAFSSINLDQRRVNKVNRTAPINKMARLATARTYQVLSHVVAQASGANGVVDGWLRVGSRQS